jgi:RNA polymerase sigma-70 factor, ECF subfamily
MAIGRARAAREAVDLTFEELYRGYHADVYRAALRELGNVHDAEDVTQAAFVDAYRAVLRGAEPQSPRAWMLAISENVRRRRFRTAQRRPREESVDDADFPLAAELPYEQARALAEALATLSPEQRRVFVLREIVGLSYDEIAGEVGSTVGSVQMLLFRARRSLREELDPPVVSRRRTGIFVPIPGWLTGLISRVEAVSLTPRAAGAIGAAAIAVAGASVSVSEAPADGRPSPATDPQPPSASTRPERKAAQPVAFVSPSPAPVAAAKVVAATRPAQRPATSKPQAAAPVAATPTIAPTTAVATAPSSPALQPALQPALPLPAGVPALEERPQLPVTLLPVAQAVEANPDVAERTVPPLPSTDPVVELATGAAEAAGASAPPLPVPSLPPGTLPPAP